MGERPIDEVMRLPLVALQVKMLCCVVVHPQNRCRRLFARVVVCKYRTLHRYSNPPTFRKSCGRLERFDKRENHLLYDNDTRRIGVRLAQLLEHGRHALPEARYQVRSQSFDESCA